MSKPLSMPFWAEDWATSEAVLNMTWAERGVYITLLAYCWLDKNCSLPSDAKRLVNLTKIPRKVWERSELIKSCFEVHPELSDRITNAKLLEEWRRSREQSAKRSEAGKIGADARWQSHNKGKYDCHGTLPLTPPLPQEEDLRSSSPREPQEKRPPAKARKKPERTDPTQIVLDGYFEGYRSRHGIEPQVAWNGKDRAVVASLLKGPPARTTEQLLALVERYLQVDDPFVKGKGWPLYLLPSQLNALTAKERAERQPTTEELEAEARATGVMVF